MPKIISQTQVFPEPGQKPPHGAITVLKRQIREKGGITREQFVWQRPEFVMVVPIYKGKILMKREFKYGVMENLLTFAAGAIKKDESPEVAARRELREEFGLQSENLVKLGTYRVSPDKSTEAQHLYAAMMCSRQRGVVPEPGKIEVYSQNHDLFFHEHFTIALCRLALLETMALINNEPAL